MVDVDDIIDRLDSGRCLKHSQRITIIAALKAAEASRIYNARKCNDDLTETYRLEEVEHQVDLAFAKLVDKKEVEDGR